MTMSTRLLPLVLTCLLVLSCEGHARSFTRCQMSRELQRYNFPRNLIARWVCLVELVSGRSTEKVAALNEGHFGYGIFQISSKDWCRKGRKGGLCSIKCEDLLNEDLADDVRCAKRVYDRVGFKAWPDMHLKCKDKSLPDLANC